MKIALAILVTALAVLACGCTSTAPAAAPGPSVQVPTSLSETSTPDLVGIWTGTTTGHVNSRGFVDAGTPVFNITVQKGQAFAGYKEYTQVLQDGTKQSEELSGVINDRGEIYIAELEDGMIVGDLTGPDTMELVYIEDGPDAKALLTILTRQRS